jgi:hypothetical protein
MPYVERDLLAHMVATADSVIACHGHGATLRFGHETCLLPLACMLEIDNANYSTACLDSLDYNWQCYNYFPMGCNIQLVFYRPGKKGTGNKPGDVLVQVLLNEQEARLPFKTRDLALLPVERPARLLLPQGPHPHRLDHRRTPPLTGHRVY